jgi:hypothetical protein
MQLNASVSGLLSFACIALNALNYFYKKQSFLIDELA